MGSEMCIRDRYLIGYAQAPVLKQALLHPDDAGAAANAQEFTKNYGKENSNLENVYLGDYNTKVLASFVEGPIGKTLREGEALKVLRDTLFASNETNMWNTGVMASLSTGKQVVSMYYPIYNDGEPLGYVGSAVYSEDLKNTLDALAEETGNKTDYLLLDAAKNTYIFCGDEEKIGGPIEEKNISEVIGLAKNEKATGEAVYEYKENGKGKLAVYEYMEDRDWGLMVLTDQDEAFATVHHLSLVLLILCAILLVLISLAVWFAGCLIAKDIKKVAAIIQEIGTLDLTLRSKLKKFGSRKDEVGMIAKATQFLTDTVSDAVVVIKEKSVELLDTSGTLHSGADVTKGSVENVEKAIHDIAESTIQQAEDTQQAVQSVLHIGDCLLYTSDAADE